MRFFIVSEQDFFKMICCCLKLCGCIFPNEWKKCWEQRSFTRKYYHYSQTYLQSNLPVVLMYHQTCKSFVGVRAWCISVSFFQGCADIEYTRLLKNWKWLDGTSKQTENENPLWCSANRTTRQAVQCAASKHPHQKQVFNSESREERPHSRNKELEESVNKLRDRWRASRHMLVCLRWTQWLLQNFITKHTCIPLSQPENKQKPGADNGMERMVLDLTMISFTHFPCLKTHSEAQKVRNIGRYCQDS